MNQCVVCGKKISSGSFCKDCKGPELIDPDKLKGIDIIICEQCQRIFSKNKWNDVKDIKEKLEQITATHVIKSAKLSKDIIVTVVIKQKYIDDLKQHNLKKIIAESELYLEKGKIREEYFLPIKIVFGICDKCGKKDTKYFEGTLQIRTNDKKTIEYVESELKEAENKRIFVTAQKELKNGKDYFITSNNFVTRFVKQLQNRFGGTVKINEKLFTHDHLRSRDLYRVTATFIQADVSKGDIISYKNKVLIVTKLEKIIIGDDLESGNRHRINYDDDYKKLEIKQTTVVNIYPNKIALDPETYEALDLVSNRKLKSGQILDVVSQSNKLYDIKFDKFNKKQSK